MPTPINIEDVYRAVGAVMAAATQLEWGLMNAVTSLSRSPLTHALVEGERGATLVQMAKRVLDRGIGSTFEDQASGRTERLGLVSYEDTQAFHEVLNRASRLFEERDLLAHSVWLANTAPSDTITGHRRRRSKTDQRTWTVESLLRLRQELVNAEHDLFVCSWNTSDAGMERLGPRQGDVVIH
jgi:hypothetical protein